MEKDTPDRENYTKKWPEGWECKACTENMSSSYRTEYVKASPLTEMLVSTFGNIWTVFTHVWNLFSW